MSRPAGALIEIAVALDGEAAEAVCALFERHGGGAVVEALAGDPAEGPRHWVRTYVPATDVEARARIEVGLWHLGQIYPLPEAIVRTLAEANWAEAWKADYRPLRIGGRFVVTPSWIEPEQESTDLLIRLDPGMAFGTGLHPTTQLCLAALERAVRPGHDVLDVGTGSGILAIGALLLGADRAVGLDIDPAAVRIAVANGERNGVRVEPFAGALGALPGEAFDVVVANLLAGTVREMAGDLFERTRPGGLCVASGILDEQERSVHEALRGAGFGAVETAASGDWVALEARRPTSDPPAR